MKRGIATAVLLLAAFPQGVAAQPAGTAKAADDPQKLGLALFTQHCSVCHSRPSIGIEPFGPALSRDSLGGQDAALRETIGNGTPRMPGFKYQFEPAQIDAIIAYIKTVPPQPAPAGAPAGVPR